MNKTHEIQSIIFGKFPIGKKIAFFNENNEVDEGRINAYVTDLNGHTNGFEVNNRIVPYEELFNNGVML